jgi:TRAP-type C4-dicarboxylate transport system substrate-binding protein
MRKMSGIVAALWVAPLAIGSITPSCAADPLTLRVADSFPGGHYISEQVTKWYMDRVAKETGNKIAFQYYPSEQLGKAKDLLSLTQTGVVDIGYVAPSFVTDKLPLSVVAELPLRFSTSCEGTAAFYKLATDGIIAKRELEPAGVRLLFTIVLPPYQMLLRSATFPGIDALKGLKIRTSGKAKELAVQKLGAVSLQIASPDVYQSLSRGTIDGMLFPYSSIFSYDVQDLIKSASVGANFGSFVVTYVISEKRWKTLPPDVQEAMLRVGRETTERGCEISQRNELQDQEKLKARGVLEVDFSPADKARIQAQMVDVSKEWAKELDGRGKPGSEVLAAFESALK